MDLSFLTNDNGLITEVAKTYFGKRAQMVTPFEEGALAGMTHEQNHVPIFLTYPCMKPEMYEKVDAYYRLLVDELLDLVEVECMEKGFPLQSANNKQSMIEEIAIFLEHFIRGQSPINHLMDEGCMWDTDQTTLPNNSAAIFIYYTRWLGDCKAYGLPEGSTWHARVLHYTDNHSGTPRVTGGYYVYHHEYLPPDLSKGVKYPPCD